MFDKIIAIQVGTACVQICLNTGVNVIATAGSKDGEEILQSMGVKKIYNHRNKSYIEDIKKAGDKIDVIVEMLANVNLSKDLEIISHGGRIVVCWSLCQVTLREEILTGRNFAEVIRQFHAVWRNLLWQFRKNFIFGGNKFWQMPRIINVQ